MKRMITSLVLVVVAVVFLTGCGIERKIESLQQDIEKLEYMIARKQTSLVIFSKFVSKYSMVQRDSFRSVEDVLEFFVAVADFSCSKNGRGICREKITKAFSGVLKLNMKCEKWDYFSFVDELFKVRFRHSPEFCDIKTGSITIRIQDEKTKLIIKKYSINDDSEYYCFLKETPVKSPGVMEKIKNSLEAKMLRHMNQNMPLQKLKTSNIGLLALKKELAEKKKNLAELEEQFYSVNQ